MPCVRPSALDAVLTVEQRSVSTLHVLHVLHVRNVRYRRNVRYGRLLLEAARGPSRSVV